jgi:hypothetical protein
MYLLILRFKQFLKNSSFQSDYFSKYHELAGIDDATKEILRVQSVEKLQ